MVSKISATRSNDNTPNTARNIGLLTGSKSFNGSLSPQDRVDFYKFRVSARSSFSLALTGLRANADVKLLNGTQKVIATSERPGTEAERIRRNLSAGEYYIQVIQRRGNTRYRLQVNSELTPVAPSRDPGSTFDTAFSVNLRNGPKAYRQFVGTTDPVDTYSFSLN
ncbi:MAG: peptidase S8, partial [Leptolyngbya sp. DLM2.Bin15]